MGQKIHYWILTKNLFFRHTKIPSMKNFGTQKCHIYFFIGIKKSRAEGYFLEPDTISLRFVALFLIMPLLVR